jgi:hypothetical protein
MGIIVPFLISAMANKTWGIQINDRGCLIAFLAL